MTLRLGIDRLLDDESLVAGSRLGLVTNYTGVTSSLEPSRRALLRVGAPLRALFSPEHGLRGTAQAGCSETDGTDPATGLPVFDTYRHSGDELTELIAHSGVDVLYFDLQDVGARFFTYIWSMLDCIRAARAIAIPCVVLDRPNPLGRERSGPGLDAEFASFVGRTNIPLRHGLTIGELARVLTRMDHPAIDDDDLPRVIAMEGWQPGSGWSSTGLPWIAPSPNLPTEFSALSYVGTALFEGTNVSEGRGTTRPFETIGAPWIDRQFSVQLGALELPGVFFRETWFAPTFSKHAGKVCGGVEIVVTDRRTYDPVRVAVAALHLAFEMYPEKTAWREPEGGAAGSGHPFIDLLWGGPTLRERIDARDLGAVLAELATPDSFSRLAQWGKLYGDESHAGMAEGQPS